MVGGGIHCSFNGQFLKPHLDFTYNPANCKKRVLNLLVYLNTCWSKKSGGIITFSRKNYPRDMGLTPIQLKVVPESTQAVFRTDNGIWHGVSVVKSQTPRISLALYYYEKRSFKSIVQAVLFGRMTKFVSHRGFMTALPYLYHKYYMLRSLTFWFFSLFRR